ncbi:helix-turn-helix domain-containing protein [Chitinophaga sp. OAE865]|uniref:helix-turn-helix domain-containing protein n=1 Tax=Chitinophaga sp. OAE865 TaxID=2817898 RepID=UPI001AEA2FF1
MPVEILTKEDFAIFKKELFQELRELYNPSTTKARKWLKSYEVREILSISPATLQTMRNNGTLAYAKVGGLLYYDYDDILKLLSGENKK